MTVRVGNTTNQPNDIDVDTGSGPVALVTQRIVTATDSPDVVSLAAIAASVDTLESLIGTTNSTLTTIDGRVDTVEALIGTTNSTLTTIDGRVDTLEALIGTTNSSVLTNTQLRASAVPVSTTSVVSTVNSTTSVLAGGAVFTGTSEDVKDYAAIQVNVIASHASATDGLSIQQSSDGTNWDHTDVYTIAAATGKTFSFQPVGRFYRVVYTNGATLQTSFRLQSVFHYFPVKASSQRPADAYTNETDMEQAWAFNSLWNGTTWDRMRGDTTNGLDVDVTRLSALVAGSAVIGKVGIDQTTPGTTNFVAANNTQINGVAISTGVGASGTGTMRVATATDSTIGTVTSVTAIGTSVTPGTSAAHLGKAEDAAHTTGDTGVMMLGVRTDAHSAPTNATGDYSFVALDKGGSTFVVPGRVTTATLSNVASSATNVTVLASNTSRQGVTIYNDSTQVLYLKYGATASTSSFTYYLAAGATWEMPSPLYTGQLDGIWASANGNARVTETSP